MIEVETVVRILALPPLIAFVEWRVEAAVWKNFILALGKAHAKPGW